MSILDSDKLRKADKFFTDGQYQKADKIIRKAKGNSEQKLALALKVNFKLNKMAQGLAVAQQLTRLLGQTDKPLYHTSKEKWHRYRQYLEPYIPELEYFIQKYGYRVSD
ncbi:hypothetical protein [Thalassomonas haliotis]|uniref:Uncharacterized protein n=1 Tax=Thalassomonas haliotis TaxID=485448 RepID=A0ABY7VHS5_9GAMM|nr:hypothetical protein [Thalassomonas haliotis]WDE13274.1 hypothetical protein H3N35_07495 [Thalassomonas haliotis]